MDVSASVHKHLHLHQSGTSVAWQSVWNHSSKCDERSCLLSQTVYELQYTKQQM